MGKIKSFLSNTKVKIATVASVAAVPIATCSNVFAEGEAQQTLTDALSSGLTQTVADLMSYIAVALPVALTAFGAFFGIKKVIGFFRSVAK